MFRKLLMFRLELLQSEKAGVIGDFEDTSKSPVSEDVVVEAEERGFDMALIKECKSANGSTITWWKDSKEGIGGSMELVDLESMFKTESSLINQCDKDPDTDPSLRHFRLLDVPPRVELTTGFFAVPGEEPSKEIFILMTGDQHASGMDLDFDGYIDMAIASKVYFYWQKVLIDVQDGKETPELEAFKTNMEAIFSDFNWDKYIAQYHALRLSLKK